MISALIVTQCGGRVMLGSRTSFVVAVAALFVAAFTPSSAFAHRMLVKVETQPNDPTHLRIDAGYEYGDAADGATVTLTDASGVEVARGTTDTDGICVLPRPAAGEYTVTVDDGAGHRESIPLIVPASEQELAATASVEPNRLVMATAGLLAIAGLTLTATWISRRTRRVPNESTSSRS